MRSVLTCVQFLLATMVVDTGTGAMGQAIVVDATGATPGRYFVQVDVSAGGVSSAVISEVVSLVDGPAPGPGGGPTSPGDLAGIGKVAYEALDLVADKQRDRNAMKLAIAYRELASRVGTDFTLQDGDEPWQQLSEATQYVRATLLGRSEDSWQPWVAAVGAELGALEEAGNLGSAAQMAAAYNAIADGLEHSPGAQRERISPEFKALIMQIIEMIIKLFLSNLGGLG